MHAMLLSHSSKMLEHQEQVASIFLFLLISVIICVVTCKIFRSSDKSNMPPSKTGWIPWVGVAIEFGKEPLNYIEKTRRELGDVFTIVAAGKSMTFICDQSDYHTFFNSRQASFGAAVQPFTKAAANISEKSFLANHTILHDTVKGKLTATYSAMLCSQLSKGFHSCILNAQKESDGGKMGLMDFVRKSMFPAVVNELFGEENLSMTNSELLQMLDLFQRYDEDFEYGVELPSIFLRKWSDCKTKLLQIFKRIVGRIRARDSPPKMLVEHLISTVDDENAPGFALLLLWASQANAVPICFWILSFILSNEEVLSQIQEELKYFELEDITEEKLRLIPSVKRAIMEAIRLRAPGMITRKLTDTLKIKGYNIPAGSLLMLSPYWTHHNPKYFHDPDKFNPDRWLECDLDKGQFLPGFVAFGGGRYQCPGRWFALMEIHLYVAMVLKLVDIELLLPSVPQPSPLHLVGSQQSLDPCIIRVQKRNYKHT